MSKDFKVQMTEILDLLGENIDISRSQHEAAIKRYEAVGDWLSKDDSPLYRFSPRIIPQGSFNLGTITRPINDNDEIDVDFVCKLERKPSNWTQKHLKEAVGDRLKQCKKYQKMLKDQDGGRRCWTLVYAEESNFHMDILPSLADNNLNELLDEEFSSASELNVDKLAVRITDKEHELYQSETDSNHWLKSNPFGYAKWFFQRAISLDNRKIYLKKTIDPLRRYEENKLPLQRIVQLLKRHRDIMFSSGEYNSDNKPISMIITTLAASAYNGSDNIYDTFQYVVGEMRYRIEIKRNHKTGKDEKWISNPVNQEENFADKWLEVREKEEHFYAWLDRLEEDANTLKSFKGKGFHVLNKTLAKQYGREVVQKTFAEYGDEKRGLRELGKGKMQVGTGILGVTGKPILNHNFEGNCQYE
ncbi:MAG: nucleotidyltransferase [Flavobacteriaceae bacterium]|nr:nucleotidyltransferase [Flavobacteriaceae bacterium]MCY4299654.1 nucleotidyltransferase [Flavobacteriaceae bacterium]